MNTANYDAEEFCLVLDDEEADYIEASILASVRWYCAAEKGATPHSDTDRLWSLMSFLESLKQARKERKKKV